MIRCPAVPRLPDLAGAPWSRAMDLRQVGKYEIVAKIGQGAMGEVFKAHDPILGRDVAIKTMTAAIGADEELRKRFHREAQSAARLSPPTIITIFDFGEDQGEGW